MGTLRKRGKKWYLRYYRKGHSYEVAAHTDSKQAAQDMLDRRVGAVKSGKRLSPKMDRLRFDEAAADVLNDYRINDRRSFTVAARRIRGRVTTGLGCESVIDAMQVSGVFRQIGLKLDRRDESRMGHLDSHLSGTGVSSAWSRGR